METQSPFLRAVNLGKTYVSASGNTEVLKNISLEINEGDNLLLLGPSGAGKSTLLHVLGLIDRPTQGQVFYENRDMTALSEDQLCSVRNLKTGFVFQFHHLLPDFSALENVMMPLLIRGVKESLVRKKALGLLESVGLAARSHHRPGQLSGGEQQRVAVARALVGDPKVIFADEPTGNLDEENGDKVFDLLLRVNKELNVALIVVTHNEHLTGRFQKIIRLVDGKIQTL